MLKDVIASALFLKRTLDGLDLLIVLKLPADRVAALLQTPGCSYFKPYDRAPMRQWLAFGAGSPAFDALADLFNEAVSFAQTPSLNKKRHVKAPMRR
ncbi:hypothetical protein [Paraburkholderia sp. MM5384-R2]|uniref:hypothetical protein n=1 Tax=Paraburkholderia sp. MM5384-R2 TaxID=2723097 RepID=UPI001622A180|nr:hypothetical protein [Paraburkholderia sp. MM5384-R2]MBB5503201.1 hypothetical protein [Paraburkholderia sp. MM5384-R2]